MVPVWPNQINTRGWTVVETIPPDTEVFALPDGSSPGTTQWAVHVLKIHATVYEKMEEPEGVYKSTKLGKNIRLLSLETWAEDDKYIYGTARIRTDVHKTKWIHLTGPK